MNKRTAILLIFLLILIGIIIIGKQREQAMQLEKVEIKAANELRRVAAEAQKARQLALEETKRIELAAQQAKQAALEKARQAELEAQQAKEAAAEAVRKRAEQIQTQIDQFVNEARALLNSGDYQKAIDAAQKILGLDPNSTEANSIIEQAKTKLKEAAAAQVDAVKDALQEQLPALGQ